jgi:putative ABC transport system permease protein
VNFVETLKLALAAIWAHKLRSVLTLLGMIIGVTAVVVVVSLIQGFNAYFDEKIANIGAKSFTVFRFDFLKDFRNTDTIAAAQRRNKELTIEDYYYLRDHATLVDEFGAIAASTFSEIKRGGQSLQAIPVAGTTANMADIGKLDIAGGRYFTKTEEEAGMRLAFLGADIADKLFPAGNAVGEEIYIAGLPYRVVGVAEAKGSVFGQSQDSYIQVPIKTYGRDFGPFVRNRWLSFPATARSDEVFNDAVEEVRQLFRARRRLRGDEEDNFAIMTPDIIMGVRDRVLGQISIVAIAVPAIALVVGGIVIMNIMLVSVTERTKEIGIRKAVGARRADVLKQFLVEAITLSAIGGAVGVFLAWVIGRIVTATFFPTYLSVTAIIVAISVSGGIGILSGIFPAWKAARLDPIEALRAD